MKIKRTTQKDGDKVISTEYTWKNENGEVHISFPSDVICIYSSSINKVVAEIFEARTIQLIDISGKVTDEYKIPSMDGYQFRGINRNNKSKSGISLLFFPTEDKLKTEWNDIEQYEFLTSENPLGEKIGIYR
jgi:hypothetical protein